MTLTPQQIRAAAWVGIALAVWLLLSLLAPVLTPFLLAGVLAYALHPAVERLHARRVPRWLGAGVALTLLMLVMLAVLLLIVPVITKQVPLLKEQVPVLLDKLNEWLVPVLGRFGVELQVDVALVRGWLQKLITGHEGELLDGLLSSLRIGGSALAAVFGNLFLMPIVAFYLLLDWPSLVARLKYTGDHHRQSGKPIFAYIVSRASAQDLHRSTFTHRIAHHNQRNVHAPRCDLRDCPEW